MVQTVVRTQIDSMPEEVAQLVSKYDLLSVPVVDLQNVLVGVVTVDDIIDVIQEQAEEDLLHLAGVDISERVTSNARESFRLRFPWLAINLATAFLASAASDSPPKSTSTPPVASSHSTSRRRAPAPRL